jgi:Sec-independent protein secretion pathway component TatC
VLRQGASLLDSVFTIPGLFPGLGDLVSPVYTLAILAQARELGLPRVVQLRMILNVAIDALFGIVPVLGDLFDVVWKANDRNMVLLEQHAYEVQRPAPGDWLFVGVAAVILTALAIIPPLILGWLITSLW